MSLTWCYWNSNNNALPHQGKNVLQIRTFLGKDITFSNVILKAGRGSQYDLFACEGLKLFPSVPIPGLHLTSRPIVIDKRTSNSPKVNWLLFFEIYMRNCIDCPTSNLTCHAGGEWSRGKDSTNGWEGQRWNAKGSAKFHQKSPLCCCLVYFPNQHFVIRVCNFKRLLL